MNPRAMTPRTYLISQLKELNPRENKTVQRCIDLLSSQPPDIDIALNEIREELTELVKQGVKLPTQMKATSAKKEDNQPTLGELVEGLEPGKRFRKNLASSLRRLQKNAPQSNKEPTLTTKNILAALPPVTPFADLVPADTDEQPSAKVTVTATLKPLHSGSVIGGDPESDAPYYQMPGPAEREENRNRGCCVQ